MAKSDALFIAESVHRYWCPADLLIWLKRYVTTGLGKLAGKPMEFGDYDETIRFDHRLVKLVFHAFTTREAKELFSHLGLQARIEKRTGSLLGRFVVVAMRMIESC